MDATSTFVVLLLVPVVAFFVFRQAVLWYWKVDEALALLREQVQLSREIRDAVRELDFEVSLEPDQRPASHPTTRS